MGVRSDWAGWTDDDNDERRSDAMARESTERRRQRQHRDDDRGTDYRRRPGGLVDRTVRRIADLQDAACGLGVAATDRSAAAMNVERNSVKMSAGRDFVTFYDAVMKNMDNGTLERAYIDPGKDLVAVAYSFDELEATGAFVSNVRGAESGRFNIVMKNVNSNASVEFERMRQQQQQQRVQPVRMQYADVLVRTDDGVETRALDDALEHEYLRALQYAVSAEVMRSAGRGAMARLTDEMGATMDWTAAPVFDVRWTEGDVSVEMTNAAGLRDPTRNSAFESVSFRRARRSQNAYRMRYELRLNDMEWTSALTVRRQTAAAAAAVTAPSAEFRADRLDVRVSVTGGWPRGADNAIAQHRRPQQQPQPRCRSQCDDIEVDVAVSGLRYRLNDDAIASRLAGMLDTDDDNGLGRIIERSLESTVREALKQEICNN